MPILTAASHTAASVTTPALATTVSTMADYITIALRTVPTLTNVAQLIIHISTTLLAAITIGADTDSGYATTRTIYAVISSSSSTGFAGGSSHAPTSSVRSRRDLDRRDGAMLPAQPR